MEGLTTSLTSAYRYHCKQVFAQVDIQRGAVSIHLVDLLEERTEP